MQRLILSIVYPSSKGMHFYFIHLFLPSKHTTSFQRCNNVVDVQTTLWTSKQRCINVKTTSCAYCVTTLDMTFFWHVIIIPLQDRQCENVNLISPPPPCREKRQKSHLPTSQEEKLILANYARTGSRLDYSIPVINSMNASWELVSKLMSCAANEFDRLISRRKESWIVFRERPSIPVASSPDARCMELKAFNSCAMFTTDVASIDDIPSTNWLSVSFFDFDDPCPSARMLLADTTSDETWLTSLSLAFCSKLGMTDVWMNKTGSARAASVALTRTVLCNNKKMLCKEFWFK